MFRWVSLEDFLHYAALQYQIDSTVQIGDRGARKNIVDINSLDLNLEPQGQG